MGCTSSLRRMRLQMKDVDLHFHATDVELDAPENKPTDRVVRVILTDLSTNRSSLNIGRK